MASSCFNWLESIEEWSKKWDKISHQKSNKSDTDDRSAEESHIELRGERDVIRYEIRPKIRGPFDGCQRVLTIWVSHASSPSPEPLVSFAAVIRVVTRHATLLPTSGEERCVTSDDPNNGCEGDYRATRLNLWPTRKDGLWGREWPRFQMISWNRTGNKIWMKWKGFIRVPLWFKDAFNCKMFIVLHIYPAHRRAVIRRPWGNIFPQRKKLASITSSLKEKYIAEKTVSVFKFNISLC